MSDYKAARDTMIESQIKPNAVTNPALLAALYKTPREAFVPPSQRSLVYMDGDLRVETAREGHPARYLLSPMAFAKLVQLARIKETDRVLDVAPATGYSTAILAQLAKEVVAIEADAGLLALAKDALAGERIENVKLVAGVPEDGAPDDGPFDVIFVNGRLETKPERLLEQLANGGRLVVILGTDTASRARLFTKIDSTIQSSTAFEIGAPLFPGLKVKEEFTF